MTEFDQLISLLGGMGVEFILIGGVAARSHGSVRGTEDLDILYRRTPENIRRIASALAPYKPYLRGAPPGLPFIWDELTIQRGLNFTLTTSLGWIDILGEIAGGGTYEDLLPFTIRARMFGIDCLVPALTKLIEVKRAAGRPKDLEAIAELEALREEKRKPDMD